MTNSEILIEVLKMGQESLSPDRYEQLTECILWIALVRA